MVTQEEVNDYINSLMKLGIHVDKLRDAVGEKFDTLGWSKVDELVEKWASEDQSY